MTQKLGHQQLHAGTFNTVEEADQTIRRLLAAGFTKDQLAVVCPVKFQKHFSSEVPQSETPSAPPGETLATGGEIGATLGGLALAATVLTGGLGAIGAAVLIGGGAIAGAFSSLIVSKGYEEEADDYFKKAIAHGHIVVGVEVPGEDSVQLREAQRILDEAEAKVGQQV